MHRTIFVGTFCAAIALGCAATPVAPADASPAPRAAAEQESLRLVIRFKDPAVDPSTPAFLKRLSMESGVTFSYLQPVSTGAHVLMATGPLSPAQREELFRRLRARPDVAYVEEDRRMHIQ